MYAVVGCSACSALWVVETDVDSTGCPRCGRRHQFERLEQFTTTESVGEARAVRAAMLAERQGHVDFDAGATVDAAVEDPVVDDREYLAGSGIDPDEVADAVDDDDAAGDSRDSREVVEAAIRTLDTPTEAAIIGYATEYGVDRGTASTLLEKLVREGVVTRGVDGYRVL